MRNRHMLSACLALVAGCGEPEQRLEPTATLLISLDGMPASGLNVRLVNSEGQGIGGGATGPDGRAVVRGPSDGPIPPGTYKVVLIDTGEDEPDPMAVTAAKRAKGRIPPAYAKPATTPLGVSIEAGKYDYPVEVKSKS